LSTVSAAWRRVVALLAYIDQCNSDGGELARDTFPLGGGGDLTVRQQSVTMFVR